MSACRSLLLVLLGCTLPLVAVESTTIAFGSCNKHDRPQPLWPAVLACAPDLWLWTGDTVYNDTRDVAVMRTRYAAQLAVAGYRELLAACPVDGTWDDHDYGANNAGREFPAKEASQAAFLDFLQVPADHARRGRAGVYGERWLQREDPDRRVQILLLDTRYHRERPGTTADMLGEEQWTWLRTALAEPAALRVLVSSIQVLPTGHRYEKWANFPASRQRLLELLDEAGPVVLVSGDRHIGEISHQDELVEITASGMTHVWRNFPGEPNRRRVGEVVSELHFGLLRVDWPAQAVELELRGIDGVLANHRLELIP